MDVQMDVPPEIIQQAHDAKKAIYEDIYDIYNEKYYEGNLNEIEGRYLNSLSIIHGILNKILDDNIAQNEIRAVPNVSDRANDFINKLVITVQSARSDDVTDNIPIKSFIDNYFFRYAWWLGQPEE